MYFVAVSFYFSDPLGSFIAEVVVSGVRARIIAAAGSRCSGCEANPQAQPCARLAAVNGTAPFGGRTDEAEVRRIIDAVEAGVNVIGTTDLRRGQSERIVGRCHRPLRNKAFRLPLLFPTRRRWAYVAK
jgi:hypothetical protein